MSKAKQLSKKLEQLNVAEGMNVIEKANSEALSFDVIEDALYIMHDDGSVSIIENMGHGVITTEAISSESILKIVQYYRPFKEVFKGKVQ
jgi:hypothetical protein